MKPFYKPVTNTAELNFILPRKFPKTGISGSGFISGEWRLDSNDGQKIFSLDLIHITKDRVTGVHCIENFNKEITECSKMEDKYTVNLVKISENIFFRETC